MKGENFLKPTKLKITITLLLVLIFNFIPIIPCKTFFGSGPDITDSMLEWTFCKFKYPIGFMFIKVGWTTNYFGIFRISGVIENPLMNIMGKLFSIVYVFIISYFISHLIIYFKNKILKSVSGYKR
jgi:hypothetical protein